MTTNATRRRGFALFRITINCTPGFLPELVEHGVDGRFYSQVRKYHHEGGRVYWFMNDSPEAAGLINRCDEAQTYEARLAAGTLPKR